MGILGRRHGAKDSIRTSCLSVLKRTCSSSCAQILSHTSPFANIPYAVREKVDMYGLGRLTPWAPQQAVLAHEVCYHRSSLVDGHILIYVQAIGWFITHGGHNSTIEAICYNVPM